MTLAEAPAVKMRSCCVTCARAVSSARRVAGGRMTSSNVRRGTIDSTARPPPVPNSRSGIERQDRARPLRRPQPARLATPRRADRDRIASCSTTRATGADAAHVAAGARRHLLFNREIIEAACQLDGVFPRLQWRLATCGRCGRCHCRPDLPGRRSAAPGRRRVTRSTSCDPFRFASPALRCQTLPGTRCQGRCRGQPQLERWGLAVIRSDDLTPSRVSKSSRSPESQSGGCAMRDYAVWDATGVRWSPLTRSTSVAARRAGACVLSDISAPIIVGSMTSSSAPSLPPMVCPRRI